MSVPSMEAPSRVEMRDALVGWYERHQRKLPWRETRDPYSIWVSEVMLQQTQVKTAIPYYYRFLEKFPHTRALAGADTESVLKAWEGLGYYARARNLLRAARVVEESHGGLVPSEYEPFRELPGVGDYIAAAVQSIVFGGAYAVVDGNVKRVLSRLFCMDEPVNRPASMKAFKREADALLDIRRPGTFNQAIMELGALVCRPTSPLCTQCPLARPCGAFGRSLVGRYPLRDKKKKVPEYSVAVGIVEKNGRLLIIRRKEEGLLGGLWEFPGGKHEKVEDARIACARKIREKTNLTVVPEARLARVKHVYTHFKIVMDVFVCRYDSGRVRLNGPVDFKWITKKRIDDYPFPSAHHKYIPKLLATRL